VRILYIEDNNLEKILVFKELEKHPNIILDYVTSITDAQNKLETCTDLNIVYDVILTDIDLPDGNGLSLVSFIRENNFNTAIVVLTGSSRENDAINALKAGADDFLIKNAESYLQLYNVLEKSITKHKNESERLSRRILALYIEDDPRDSTLMQKYFATCARNIILVIAGNAEEAFSLLDSMCDDKERCFNVIIVDYSLPGLNGLELSQKILDRDDLDIPIIMLTGQGSAEIAIHALSIGISDYIIKDDWYLYKMPFILESTCSRAKLKQEQTALRESEKRLRDLFDHMSEGISYCRLIHKDGKPVDWTYISVNNAFELLTGLKDVVGKNTSEIFPNVHESYSEIFDTFSRVCRSGHSEKFDSYIELFNKWFSISVYSIEEDYFVVLFDDISSRKNNEALINKSLAEKDILLKEIHHRVKNNLQIILSFISLQKNNKAQKDPVDIIHTIENRIRSISIVHELVYQTQSISEIDIYKYIKILINQILSQYNLLNKVSFTIDADNICLDINLMVPVGIILNELTTNAVKHGFNENKGKISISISKKDDIYTLIFSDNGKGIDSIFDINKVETLGMNLIYSLARQIDGEAKVESDNGTKVTITFKDIRLATYSNMSAYM
jgi:two-component sensor histidine kinase/DNA-binding response OmpR family regulator